MPITAVNSDTDFQREVIAGQGLVLAGFTAQWCPHCKVLAPKMQAMAEAMPQIKLCRVDVDKAAYTAEKYGVKTLPVLMFFRDGKKLSEKMIAGLSEQEIMGFIQAQLK